MPNRNRRAVIIRALLLSAGIVGAGESPFHIAAEFSETIITLRWAEIPGAKAYNIYARYSDTGFVRVNPVPVTTRPQYSFIWVGSEGEKKRVVKGNAVSLYVAALEGTHCNDHSSSCRETKKSGVVETAYFHGYARIVSAEDCGRVLHEDQEVAPLLSDVRQVSRRAFLREYPPYAAALDSIYRHTIDPKDEGACVPISTIASKLLTARGIPCYRCQGVFINQFHNFNLVVIDGVEYVLDFTANQFLPNSSPVLIPRDRCFIDSLGFPTGKPVGTVTRIYTVEKVFDADQISFTDKPEAQKYKGILDTLLAR